MKTFVEICMVFAAGYLIGKYRAKVEYVENLQDNLEEAIDNEEEQKEHSSFGSTGYLGKTTHAKNRDVKVNFIDGGLSLDWDSLKQAIFKKKHKEETQ